MKVITHGALSVISAFASGIGSAVGIDQAMEVTFDGNYADNPVVIKKTLSALNKMFRRGYLPGIQVVSEIPRTAGFKTSSALTGAIVCGYLHHFGLKEQDAALLTAECSRANGTSVTGALDDANACLKGGLSLTDNFADKIIMDRKIDETSVIIAWPSGRRRNTVKSADPVLRRYSPSIGRLKQIVESGDFRDAMVLNGLVYGMHFNLDLRVLRYFYSMGATHSCGTGKGPGIFAFFSDPKLEEAALKEFRFQNYKIKMAKLSNAPYKVED